MPSPELSIIILNYQAEKFCHQCLLSLQTSPPSVPYEIILVDNASADESVTNLRKVWGEVLPIRFISLEENAGYGGGNVRGVEASAGKYIAILNPDVAVHKGALDGLLAFLKIHPTVGLVAPKLLSPDGTLQDSFRRFPTFFDLVIKRLPCFRQIFHKRLQRFLMWDIDLSSPSRVDWVVGACLLLRRQAWEEAGGFDPRYFLFLEDTDLCRSLWEKGWEVVFHPGFAVNHYQERLSETKSFLDLLRKKTVRIHFMSALKYFWKWRNNSLPRKA